MVEGYIADVLIVLGGQGQSAKRNQSYQEHNNGSTHDYPPFKPQDTANPEWSGESSWNPGMRDFWDFSAFLPEPKPGTIHRVPGSPDPQARGKRRPSGGFEAILDR